MSNMTNPNMYEIMDNFWNEWMGATVLTSIIVV